MLRRVFRVLRTIGWFLPGLLLWASFPPFGEKVDSLVALAPLLWLVRRGEERVAVKWWFANGLLFWVCTLMWMPAIMKNGGPMVLVALGWGALSAYCALYFAAFGYFAARFWRWAKAGAYWRRLLAILVAEPVLWAGLEWLRSTLFGGFAWNHLGTGAINAGFGAPAALGGVYLVSACVILASGTLVSIVERMLEPVFAAKGFPVTPAPRWLRSVETILPLAIVWLFFHLAPDCAKPGSRYESGGEISAALVQRNYPPVFDRERAMRENAAETYGKLFANVSPLKPDLVVLAESAMAEFGAIDSRRAGAFADFALAESGASALIAGGSRSVDGKEFNSAALYAGNSPFQIYDKVHLVPFGEYIPFDKTFPCLQRFAPVGSCTPGRIKLLDLNGLKIGVAICFEGTDSVLIRKFAKMGAQLLVFITNDTWFSDSSESVQHAWQSVARAVETGLPILRVGNSGVTGAVASSGAAAWLTDSSSRPLVDEKGTMVEIVRYPAKDALPLTPYVKTGDKPLVAAFILIVAFIAVFARKKKLPEEVRELSDEDELHGLEDDSLEVASFRE
ncbi:MAG: apolipoprotein N-acyltransferase [Kiritimatiellae bacterium]|nr:apolipoprotein N-acyltransferase [Kiritimatiellia bacterium]